MGHTRKDYRLKNFDYSSPNAYFVTICTKNREALFWQRVIIENVGAAIGRPKPYELSPYGKIADEAINKISEIYPNVVVNIYAIMPDHIHLILTIKQSIDENNKKISTIVNQLKGYVSKRIGFSPWQKLYYDHIIRDDEDFLTKYEYIENNPLKWFEKYNYIDII